MKFSYSWLTELVDNLQTTPRELERLITLRTAECEGIEEAGAMLAEASAARVVSAEALPGTHAQRVVVETARYGTKTVVCGAPNCRAGLSTVYVPVATAVIHGVPSEGMLASAQELGLSRDHTGILELEGDFALGPDFIIEVDNKSLTHRPDLWGHFGMAREVAAIAGGTLRDPVNIGLLPPGQAPVSVDIADFALCPRYSALVFENVSVRPSPLWLQYRLHAVGLNPINNIVDVTNYVMAELAQPMHAFDADKLHGTRIFVRPAHDGEKLEALNDNTYTLNSSNLVIADAECPIALAGVIGGSGSAISDSTTRIVLESALFQASSIRKTSSQLKLRTDASMRFEKAQDPANTVRALARAVALLKEVSPGIQIQGGLADVAAPAHHPAPAELAVDWICRKLGRTVSGEEIERILESLGFGVNEVVPGILAITVPSWRATKDVAIKDDLLEEIGRMVGFDSIVPKAPMVPAVVPPAEPRRMLYRSVRRLLVDQGFTEAFNYSFVEESELAKFGLRAADHVAVLNPIASNQTHLRSSLLLGIYKNVLENSKHFGAFRLFEIGHEIHKGTNGLPSEVPHMSAAIYAREDGAPGLFELKRVAECLMRGCEITPATARAFEHPERAAVVSIAGEEAGRLFEFHPSLGIEGRAAVLDIDLEVLAKYANPARKYQPLRRFPTSAFDLSVITAEREPVGAIQRQLAQLAASSLVSIEYVRQYAGPPLSDEQKSVSCRLTIGASDRTLSSEEVSIVRAHIIDGMRALGYELRV